MDNTSQLVTDIKVYLRIKNNAYDNEVNDLIESAKMDLKLAGVNVDKAVNETIDPLLKSAIKYYCKAHFGYDDNSETFDKAYYNLKIAMSLSGEYQESDTDV